MKVLLAGNMARDAVVAERLAAEGCELHIAASIDNPSLIEAAHSSEGQFYPVTDVASPREIARVALAAEADLMWVNQDEGLMFGLVDAVRDICPDTLIASPDSQSARIEWDKFEAREIIKEIDDEQGTAYNPIYERVDEFSELVPALDRFQADNIPVVVKPRGLTGGKGVKVMGPHLADYDAARWYAIDVLKDHRQQGLLLEEKVEGYEFTIQGLTDGITMIAPPVTYDYPYREDGDTGPGTGGMGSFTMPPGEQLPFMDEGDYMEAVQLMRGVLLKQRERGRDFKGVLYGSFFKTAEGLKVVEFNARMGDPEGLNIVELLAEERPLINTLHNIARGVLSEDDVRFKRMASTAVYLVSPDYGYDADEKKEFVLDMDRVAAAGCRAYFGAAERIQWGDQYRTTGSSRTVALTSCALTPWDARTKIHEAIRTGLRGPLQYRHDVGDHDYIRIDLSR
jgi:phosphoribosylamine--glycine ligase